MSLSIEEKKLNLAKILIEEMKNIIDPSQKEQMVIGFLNYFPITVLEILIQDKFNKKILEIEQNKESLNSLIEQRQSEINNLQQNLE